MTRSQLWALNCVLAAAVIVAAWWAMNAARVAEPSPTRLEAVALPTERPPLPPAPFRRAPLESGDGVGRRDVFASAPVEVVPDRALAPDGPVAVGVLVPGVAAPRRDLDGPRLRPRNDDPFQFADGLPPPSYDQFFGGHLIAPERRLSDRDGIIAVGEPGSAPLYAPTPRPNPRGASVADGPSQGIGPTLAEGAVDGLILLGVFRSSGEERALVRLPDGEAVRVVQGDEIRGWRVSEISDEFIELQRASQTQQLRLPD